MLDFIFYGFIDGVSANCFAGLAVMLLVFLFFRPSRRGACLYMAAYSLPYFFITMWSHYGVFGRYLMSFEYNQFVSLYYIILGVSFILFGILFLFFWFQSIFKKNNCHLRQLKAATFLVALAIFCFSCVNALPLQFWPLSEAMLLQRSQLFLPGYVLRVLIGFGLHSVLRLWILVLVLLGYLSFAVQGKVFKLFQTRYSVLCILAAGFYMALGGVLIYFYYPTM